MRQVFFFAFIAMTFSFCNGQADTTRTSSLLYLPLGDSYTICEGATAAESWPELLVKNLKTNNIDIALAGNPARTGYTTQNLIDRELPLLDKTKIDFATICIGVNDWVQGIDSATFRKNLVHILDVVSAKISKPQHIILITIPDFGVTPAGQYYSGGRNISEGIASFNQIIRQEAETRKLPLVDLFPLSKKMGSDVSLVAPDGLHPSAKEYALWEKIIFPEALKMLK